VRHGGSGLGRAFRPLRARRAPRDDLWGRQTGAGHPLRRRPRRCHDGGASEHHGALGSCVQHGRRARQHAQPPRAHRVHRADARALARGRFRCVAARGPEILRFRYAELHAIDGVDTQDLRAGRARSPLGVAAQRFRRTSIRAGPGGRGRRGSVMRILLTTDTVGGVWTYALDLAHALARAGVEVVLAAVGPTLSERQRLEAAESDLVAFAFLPAALEWMPDPWADVARTQDWALD